MRLFSLAQFALLGATLTLSACADKQADTPATESTPDPSAALSAQEAAAMGNVPPSSTSPYKRYGIQRAQIKYEVSGFRRGVEALYFDNWGRQEARHINVEDITPQAIRPAKNVIVTNGSYMQMADLVGGNGSFMIEKVVDSLLKLSKVDPPEVISDSIMTRMGYKRIGDSSILGKPTSVWYEAMTGTKLYSWAGVVLKQEVKNAQHQQTVLAISIDTATPIHDSIFTAPKGIEFKPMPPRPSGPGGPPRGR